MRKKYKILRKIKKGVFRVEKEVMNGGQ